MLQQKLLCRDAAAEAGHFASGPDHPMTRNDDWQWVRPVRRADSLAGPGLPDRLCNVALGRCCPKGNLPQGGPDTVLERCAVEEDREAEVRKLSGEVRRKFRKRRAEPCIIAAPLREVALRGSSRSKADQSQVVRITRNEKIADGAIEIAVQATMLNRSFHGWSVVSRH